MALFMENHPAISTFIALAGACVAAYISGINVWLFLSLALLFSYYFCNLLSGIDVLIKTIPRDLWALYTLIDMKVRGRYYHATNNTIVDIWERTVGRFHTKDAFICDDLHWSFDRVDDFANRMGHFCKTQVNLQTGDTIGVFLLSMYENAWFFFLIMGQNLYATGLFSYILRLLLPRHMYRPEYVGVWLGIAKVGCVSALINFNLRHDALLHCIRVANCRALVVGKEMMDAYLEIADQLDQNIPVYCIGTEGEKEPTDKTDAKQQRASRDGILDLDVLLPRMPTNKPDRISVGKSLKGFKEKLLYVYTSGTTGMPKAAVITNARFFLFARGVHNALSIRRNDISYTPLPLYHTAGGIIGVGQVILHGSTMVIRKKFSASKFWDDCIKYKCTVGQYVGELCRYLLAQPVRDSERQHCVRLMFGNGMRQQVWREFQARFAIPQIGEFYGATESNANLVNYTNTPGSCGFTSVIAPWAYPVRLIRTDPETGAPLRDATGMCIKCKYNEPGELVGKIKQNTSDPLREFHGYVDNTATSKKLIRDVFRRGDSAFLTGDMLVQDKYGCMYFCDRLGDTFRWKGENVATTEVEGQVMKCCQKDCVVFGAEVPNSEGKAGMACIVTADARANDDDLTDDDADLRRANSIGRRNNTGSKQSNGAVMSNGGSKTQHSPPTEIDLDKLLKHLQLILPHYAVPIFVRLVSKVEQTGTFKLKKSDLCQAGYDPSKTAPDPVYYLDTKAKHYKLIDEQIYRDILDGKVKF